MRIASGGVDVVEGIEISWDAKLIIIGLDCTLRKKFQRAICNILYNFDLQGS